MNHLLNVATAANFATHQIKLDWAKKNLDADIYKKIKKSYNDTFKYTLIVTLALLIIYFIAIMQASSIQDSQHSTFDTWKTGHVLGNTVWYIKNDKYEINLSDYGYDSVNFSDGDYFRVYLDKDGNIIKITPDNEVNKILEDSIVAIVMVGGLIFMIIVLTCVHVPIVSYTCGKIWGKYAVWFEKADLQNDKFTIE